jgi:hypothetical protein
MLYFLWPEIKEFYKSRRRSLIISTIVCAIGSIGFASWYFWQYRKEFVRNDQNTDEFDKPEYHNALDRKILIECQPAMMPSAMPATGVLHTVAFGYVGVDPRHISQSIKLAAPGEALQLLPEQKGFGTKCSVFNRTDVSLFNLTTYLKVQEFEAVVPDNKPEKGLQREEIFIA